MFRTVWTQLTYHFNWRTAKPLGPSTAPGCGEPTSLSVKFFCDYSQDRTISSSFSTVCWVRSWRVSFPLTRETPRLTNASLYGVVNFIEEAEYASARGEIGARCCPADTDSCVYLKHRSSDPVWYWCFHLRTKQSATSVLWHTSHKILNEVHNFPRYRPWNIDSIRSSPL